MSTHMTARKATLGLSGYALLAVFCSIAVPRAEAAPVHTISATTDISNLQVGHTATFSFSFDSLGVEPGAGFDWRFLIPAVAIVRDGAFQAANASITSCSSPFPFLGGVSPCTGASGFQRPLVVPSQTVVTGPYLFVTVQFNEAGTIDIKDIGTLAQWTNGVFDQTATYRANPLRLTVTAVPEPGGFALLCAGLLAGLVVRHRKRV